MAEPVTLPIIVLEKTIGHLHIEDGNLPEKVHSADVYRVAGNFYRVILRNSNEGRIEILALIEKMPPETRTQGVRWAALRVQVLGQEFYILHFIE